MTSSPNSSSDDRQSTAFELLHQGIQRWVWKQGWSTLRPIQERAAVPILGGTLDVIISAPTAGGKTEAAFLPIASRLAESVDEEGVGCLCLSPLKALINDQAERLTPLFECVGLPLTPWHGDVSPARKKKLLDEKRGALLITPESLEAFFVLRGSLVPKLLAGLQFVVVDELHTFIGTERGRQVQSLLNRVELAIRKRIPRVALSATLGDMILAAEALRPGEAEKVILIEGQEDGHEIRIQLRGYKLRRPKPGPNREEVESGDASRLVADLFRVLRGTDNLVFANSRCFVEKIAADLASMSDRAGVPNEFLVHHGSLSKEIREEAERRVKDPSKPTSVVCTSTLELGIDIGSVASIAQIGSPPSVASLRQRLGRSGRREGEPAVLRTYVMESELDPQSDLLDELRPDLIQSIAMTQLLLAGWCEPPVRENLQLSTLIQQILSVIAQHGGASARDLHSALCRSGPFRNVSEEVFIRLLKCLGARRILTQVSDGDLTLGDQGEKQVEHYTFYTAFQTSEEYRLIAGEKALGSVPVNQSLSVGDSLIFAGRRWRILSISESSRTISLAPAKGGRPPHFVGDGPQVHDRVREEMYLTYSAETVPAYLDAMGRELLAEARAGFRRHRLESRRVVERSSESLLFPWIGDRGLDTLALQLRGLGMQASKWGVAICIREPRMESLGKALENVAEGKAPQGADLATVVGNRTEEKYDWLLTPELSCLGYASRHFDEARAQTAAREILSSMGKL